MERVYRIIFLGLFILGFIGAVASADLGENGSSKDSSVAALIKDVRMAQEINALNEGRWNQDVGNLKEDGIARVENLMEDAPGAPAEQPPLIPDDYTTRAKSELAE